MAKSVQKDADGVEFNVETGYGNVVKVEQDEGKRNAHVEFKADNLRLPVKGWVDTTNPDLWEVVIDARDTGKRVSFRIETHRSDSVDKTIPMSAVGQFDRFRRLVEVKPAGGVMAQPEKSTAPTPGPQTSDHDPGPSDPGDYGESFDRTQRRGPRVAEGKPWEPTNSDGSPNLASYAFLAAVGTVEWAHSLVAARAAETAQDGPPAASKVKALATMLLDASDSAQASIRQDGRVDRMDGSHTRARGAIRSVVEATGVPWDSLSDTAGRLAWVDFLATRAAELLRIALELNGRPSKVAAA